jgi:septal ring factor EnvC (AmiA/AmiB activator)
LGAQRDTLIQGSKAQAQTINTLRDNIASQREAFQGLLTNQQQTISALQQTNARLEETAAANQAQLSQLERSVIETNDLVQTTQTQIQEVQEREENNGTFFGNLLRTLNPFRNPGRR